MMALFVDVKEELDKLIGLLIKVTSMWSINIYVCYFFVEDKNEETTWTIKTAPKSMVSKANREMLNMPSIVPRAAKRKLWSWFHIILSPTMAIEIGKTWGCGHWPCWLRIASSSGPTFPPRLEISNYYYNCHHHHPHKSFWSHHRHLHNVIPT